MMGVKKPGRERRHERLKEESSLAVKGKEWTG